MVSRHPHRRAQAASHTAADTHGAVVRAPMVATVAPRTQSMGMAAVRSDLDVDRVVREQYLANVYLYAGIQAIAEDISSLNLRFGRDPDKPNEWNANHPLARRLGPTGAANPEMTGRRLLAWTVAQWIIAGRFAWEIDPGDGSLWPLPAGRVEPVPTTGGAAYFARFDYDVGQGKKRPIPADRVVYHWRPSQSDLRKPESVLQAARLDLSVAVMQDLYDYAFLQNDARPAAVIVHERFEEETARDAWRRGFIDTHRGAANAGKIHFAEASPDGAAPKDALFVQTLGLSQKDAEFIRRYESKIRSILIAVGTPLARLGDPTAATYANAKEAMSAYWKNTVRTVAVDLAEAINVRLAPKYGLDVCWFDFGENEYLREVPRISVADGIAAHREGLMTREEVRVEVLQLPEVPTLGVLDDPTPAAIEPPAPTPALDPASPADDTLPLAASALAALVRDTVAELITPLIGERRDVIDVESHEESPQERRARQWRAFDDTTGPMERRWTKRWQRLFDRQATAVVARLNGKRGRQALRDAADPDVDALFDRSFWEGETVDLAVDMFDEVVGQSLRWMSGQVGTAFDVESPWAQDFIEARSNRLAGQVTETTYNGIKAALAEGVANGESIDDLAARIEGLFAQTYAGRATTVARTEVVSAYNGSTVLAAENSDGLVEGFEWIATRDDRTRGNDPDDEFDHLDADGQTVDIGEAFDVSGEPLAYPGDPDGSPGNIINCRCTIAPVVAQAGRSGRTLADVIPIDRAMSAAIAVAQGALQVGTEDDARRALRVR